MPISYNWQKKILTTSKSSQNEKCQTIVQLDGPSKELSHPTNPVSNLTDAQHPAPATVTDGYTKEELKQLLDSFDIKGTIYLCNVFLGSYPSIILLNSCLLLLPFGGFIETILYPSITAQLGCSLHISIGLPRG